MARDLRSPGAASDGATDLERVGGRGDHGAARRMLADALDAPADALPHSILRPLLTHMMADARTTTPSLEPLLASRPPERVADLATGSGGYAAPVAEEEQLTHGTERRAS